MNGVGWEGILVGAQGLSGSLLGSLSELLQTWKSATQHSQAGEAPASPSAHTERGEGEASTAWPSGSRHIGGWRLVFATLVGAVEDTEGQGQSLSQDGLVETVHSVPYLLLRPVPSLFLNRGENISYKSLS